MSSMTVNNVRIPDPNEPERLPDGVAGNFYFWLGDEQYEFNFEDPELGDVDVDPSDETEGSGTSDGNQD